MRKTVKKLTAVGLTVTSVLGLVACGSSKGTTSQGTSENQSWFKKRKKKPEQEEKTKSDYEKLVEGSKITKGMFAVHQKKNDYYFEIPTSLLGRATRVFRRMMSE